MLPKRAVCIVLKVNLAYLAPVLGIVAHASTWCAASPLGAAQPGTVSFDVLVRPGRGLAKLGYKVKYRWTDRPAEILTGMVRP